MKKITIDILKRIKTDGKEYVANIPDAHYIKKARCKNEFIINQINKATKEQKDFNLNEIINKPINLVVIDNENWGSGNNPVGVKIVNTINAVKMTGETNQFYKTENNGRIKKDRVLAFY